MNNIRAHSGAVIIIALFAILATIYSLITPIFEASDEISHYPVVQHIAATGQLPVQRPGVETLWEQEGSQPPLYYLLSAGLTFWIDTGDLADIRWRNPHAKLGIPLDLDNKNMVIHTEAEAFPWQGTVLAVHLIRFFSVVLSTISVVLVYLLARTIWPNTREISLLSTALTAFNPMFLFISGSVNNDNLIVLAGTWSLLLVVRILKTGLTTRRVITLAIVVALGSITKISGLTLFPIVGLALLIHAVRTGKWHETILAGLTVVGIWTVLAGWWYLRNITLYGELLGIKTHVAIAGPRIISLGELAKEWYGFWVSYWALFGAVNILADAPVYYFYGAISWVALGGIAWWFAKKLRVKDHIDLLLPGLLVAQVLIVFAGVIRWTLTTYASQGRLMFPAIGAISGLSAFGLINWVPPRWRQGVFLGISALMLTIAAIAPFRYIAPVYASPAIVEKIPESATPIGAYFDDLELVAVEAQTVTVEEGGHIPIKLYWRAKQPIEIPYSLYLHALGRGYTEIGKIDTYPGGGLLPTTQMQPGVITQDSYLLELDPAFDAPTIVRILIGVWDTETNQILKPTTADGVAMGSVIVETGVAYPDNREGCQRALPNDTTFHATFGHFAAMRAEALKPRYTAGDDITVTLYWDRLGSTETDWTIFIHLLNTKGVLVSQADAPPLSGDYPTSLWLKPCQVIDTHVLHIPDDLPTGDYQILVGLYNTMSPTLVRAPALNSNGSPYPNNAVRLGTITVENP